MKKPEIAEGQKAGQEFVRATKAIAQAPKSEVVAAEKKQKGKRRKSSPSGSRGPAACA